MAHSKREVHTFSQSWAFDFDFVKSNLIFYSNSGQFRNFQERRKVIKLLTLPFPEYQIWPKDRSLKCLTKLKSSSLELVSVWSETESDAQRFN